MTNYSRKKVWRERGSLGIALAFLSGSLLAGWFLVPAAAESLQPITTVLHVHSRISTGDRDLDGLAAEARRYGVGALIMSENFVLQYEYGLFPLRGVLRLSKSWPSVVDFGLDRYLAELHDASRRNPDMIFLPGVEVVAHYYWTGSLVTRNLTMYDGQKNLLLLGSDDPEFYRRIPAPGNVEEYTLGWQSVSDAAVPLTVGGIGVWLLRTSRTRLVQVGQQRLLAQTRRLGLGIAVLLIAGALAVGAFPFLESPFDVYDAGLGVRPHQAVLDYAKAHGALSVWSMPEAPDFHRLNFGMLGAVTIKTDPYLQILQETDGYTAFGAVYAQPVTVADAGGKWDSLLRAYCSGSRAAPVWGVAESAFHKAAHGKRLTEAETVVWVREKSRDAILEALARGRAYARRRGDDYALALDAFSVSAAASGGPELVAMSGEALKAPGPFTVHLRISASDGVPRSVPVQVIRAGSVIREELVTLPAELAVVDAPPVGQVRTYYRLLIGGGGYRVVSNPIFVELVPAGGQSDTR